MPLSHVAALCKDGVPWEHFDGFRTVNDSPVSADSSTLRTETTASVRLLEHSALAQGEPHPEEPIPRLVFRFRSHRE